MRILSYRAAALIAALLILPGAARAQWVIDGSTQTSQIPGSKGNNDATTVNYAVYNNISGGFTAFVKANSSFKAALISSVGAAGLTKLENSSYVYFYQVASPVQTTIKEFYVGNPGATTIAASVNGYVFQEKGSAVTTGALSNTQSPNGLITGSNPTDLTFTSNSGAKGTSPDGTDSFGDTGNPNTEFSLNGSTGIAKGQYSGIMVLGSNNPYMLGEVETGDGGQATAFGVPVPGPEPSTFALLALALPILGLGYARRLKNRLKGVAPLAA